MCVAIERYMAVINKKPVSDTVIWIMIALVWSTAWFAFALFGVWSNTYPFLIGLQSSKLYCVIAWWYNVRGISILNDSLHITLVSFL